MSIQIWLSLFGVAFGVVGAILMLMTHNGVAALWAGASAMWALVSLIGDL